MLLIIMGGALFLAVMLLAVVLPINPSAVKIVSKMVCRGDEKMEVKTSIASYHQPGERSIEIYCNDYGKMRDVKGKTLLFSFLFSFAIMFPFSILIVMLIYKLFIS